MNDGAHAVGPADGPDEEGDASCGDDVGFVGEEMADLVYWEVDCGEGSCPEDDKREEILR